MITGLSGLFAPPAVLVPVTIASGESLSTAAAIPTGYVAAGITLPAAWTGSSLTFQISFDGSTWFEVTDGSSGAIVDKVLTDAAASQAIYTPVWNLFRASFLKVRSGTHGSPTAQGGDRGISIICLKGHSP
jgi:hypothetical protein